MSAMGMLRQVGSGLDAATPVQNKQSYCPDAEQQDGDWTERRCTQVVKIRECAPARILRVVEHNNLLANGKFVVPRTLPSSVGFAIHLKFVAESVVISRFVSRYDPRRGLLTSSNLTFCPRLLNQERQSENPRQYHQ